MESNPVTNPVVKRTVLDYDDIVEMAPFFKGKRRLVEMLMKALDVDKVNWIHDHNFDTPGTAFCRGLLNDLDIKLSNCSTICPRGPLSP